MDVIAPMGDQRIPGEQLGDLVNFGRYMLCIAANSQEVLHDPARWIEIVKRRYPGGNLGGALSYLINLETTPPEYQRVLGIYFGCAGYLCRCLSTVYCLCGFTKNLILLVTTIIWKDTYLANWKMHELYVYLAKMGFINERPEFDQNPQWRESGDRFLLKLFRDYVFHQVNDMGEPVVDFAHVFSCLNKLDAGTEERIMLVSRDEQACFIVTYKEVSHLTIVWN